MTNDKDRVVNALQHADWATINRLGNACFDPHSHGFKAAGPSSNHCAVCLLPRGDHKNLIWRLAARVLRWGR